MREDNTLVEQIKDLVSQELAKRCIFAKIKKCEIINEGRGIEIETEDFQTIPVMFKRLYIKTWGSTIKHNTGIKDTIDIYITLDYAYEHFEGGRNGSTLMQLELRYFEESDRLLTIKIS